MTKFNIKRDGLIIGFEEHTKAGCVHWYNDEFNAREEIPGPFPANEEDEKNLINEKNFNRREEKR